MDNNIVLAKSFDYSGSQFEYETDDHGVVWMNITHMCKVFGKELKHLLELKEIRDVGMAILRKIPLVGNSDQRKLTENRHFEEFGLTKVRGIQGGGTAPSTWAKRDLALHIAMKCDIEFYLHCLHTLTNLATRLNEVKAIDHNDIREYCLKEESALLTKRIACKGLIQRTNKALHRIRSMKKMSGEIDSMHAISESIAEENVKLLEIEKRLGLIPVEKPELMPTPDEIMAKIGRVTFREVNPVSVAKVHKKKGVNDL
jgi:hypothetical protein